MILESPTTHEHSSTQVMLLRSDTTLQPGNRYYWKVVEQNTKSNNDKLKIPWKGIKLFHIVIKTDTKLSISQNLKLCEYVCTLQVKQEFYNSVHECKYLLREAYFLSCQYQCSQRILRDYDKSDTNESDDDESDHDL
jgi:hypothetical protein